MQLSLRRFIILYFPGISKVSEHGPRPDPRVPDDLARGQALGQLCSHLRQDRAGAGLEGPTGPPGVQGPEDQGPKGHFRHRRASRVRPHRRQRREQRLLHETAEGKLTR